LLVVVVVVVVGFTMAAFRYRAPGHSKLTSTPCTSSNVASRSTCLNVAWIVVPAWLSAKKAGARELLSEEVLTRVAGVRMVPLAEAKQKLREESGLFRQGDKWTSDVMSALSLIMEGREVTSESCIRDWNGTQVTEAVRKLLEAGTWKLPTGLSTFLTRLQAFFSACGRTCLNGCCRDLTVSTCSGQLVSALNPLDDRTYRELKEFGVKFLHERASQSAAEEWVLSTDAEPVAQASGSGHVAHGPPINAGFAMAMISSVAPRVIEAALCDPKTKTGQQVLDIFHATEAYKFLVFALSFGSRTNEPFELRRYTSITVPYHDGTACTEVPLRAVQRGGDALWDLLRAGVPVKFNLWQSKHVQRYSSQYRTLRDQRLSIADPIIATLVSYQIWDMYFPRLSAVQLAQMRKEYEFLCTEDQIYGYIDTWVYKTGLSAEPDLAELYARFTPGQKIVPYCFRYGAIGGFAHIGADPKTIAACFSQKDPSSQQRYAQNKQVASCPGGRMDVYDQARRYSASQYTMGPEWRDNPYYTQNQVIVTGTLHWSWLFAGRAVFGQVRAVFGAFRAVLIHGRAETLIHV
jgi:hypothetical protein